MAASMSTVVDLRDYPMPFFSRTMCWSPRTPGRPTQQYAVAVAWQQELAEFDGYIFVVAEYNRSITGVLKNALDQAYVEWANKADWARGLWLVAPFRRHLVRRQHLRLIGVRSSRWFRSDTGCRYRRPGDFFRVHPGFGGVRPTWPISNALIGASAAQAPAWTTSSWWANATTRLPGR